MPPSDRRGRHDRSDPLQLKRPDRGEALEQEQEQERSTKTEKETRRDPAQDQLGNQGVAELLGLGPALELVDQLDATWLSAEHLDELEDAALQFGGDDDLPVDGPLTPDPEPSSLNQRLKRRKEPEQAAEPGEDDTPRLPPEDPEWLDALGGLPQPTPGSLQPSPQAAIAGGAAWIDAATLRWPDDLIHRALARLILPVAPCLVDPHGRALLARARALAIAAAPLQIPPTDAVAEHLSLELSGQRHVVDEVVQQVRDSGVKLPKASTILSEILELRQHEALPGATPGDRVLQRDLAALLGWRSARRLLPDLRAQAPATSDPDDPLDLDAVLAAHTGGRPDPVRQLQEAAVRAAEAIAAATSQLRASMAATAIALAEARAAVGLPDRSPMLLHLAICLDRDVQGILQLLVEIARAAQAGKVAPRGLHNGLKRACRQLDLAHTHVVAGLASIAEVDLPQPSPPARERGPDPLALAWADGSAGDALTWLEAQPAGPSRELAVALTRAAGGAPIPELQQRLTALRDGLDDGPLVDVLELCLASSALWCSDPRASLRWSEGLRARATAHGDALMLAASALTGVEAHLAAGDPAAAAALRLEAGRACHALGADGAVSLLSRWTPPTDPPEGPLPPPC